MSSRNYTLANVRKKITLGQQYDATDVLLVQPSLLENQMTTFFNPNTCGPSGNPRCDLIFANSDEYNLNELYLEFTLNNLDPVITQTIYNPWLIFSEMKVSVNNQELLYLDNAEKIFMAQAAYYKRFTADDFSGALQELFPTNFTTALTSGEVSVVSAGKTYSLPLFVLFPFLKDISRSQGVNRLSVELRFQTNTASASSIGRFITSSTASNCYTATTVSFSNIQLRQSVIKNSDPYLRNVPNPVMPMEMFEDRQFAVSWNSLADTKRLQIGQEFSHHQRCTGLSVYIRDDARVTTFNDADSGGRIFSTLDLFGIELRYKSRSIVKFDTANESNKRLNYYRKNQLARYGAINHNRLNNADNSSVFWMPNVFIDLQNVGVADYDGEKLYSGLSNADGSLELILTNTTGVFSTGCVLIVVLHFYEFKHLDAKTGVISAM